MPTINSLVPYRFMCTKKINKLYCNQSALYMTCTYLYLFEERARTTAVMSTCRVLRDASAGNVPADNFPPEKLNNSCNHPSVTDELKLAAGYSTPFFPCPSKASDPNPHMARFLMNEATASFPTLCSSFDPTVPTCTEEIWCCIGHQRNGP